MRPKSAKARDCESAIAEQLSTSRLGRPVTFFPAIDSTNNYALKVSGGEESHGRLLVADRQSAGRGRRGRHWLSRPGADLLFSLILYPPAPQEKWPLLTLLFAAAVCETLEERLGLKAKIRWPNDVLVGGKKVCGILTEVAAFEQAAAFEQEGAFEQEVGPDRLIGSNQRLVLGVGLNVNSASTAWPAELQATATTLKEERRGRSLRRWPLLNALLLRFERLYEAFCNGDTSTTDHACRRWMSVLGRLVEVRLADRTLRGAALELEERGGLVVREDSGATTVLHCGDVVEIRPKEQAEVIRNE